MMRRMKVVDQKRFMRKKASIAIVLAVIVSLFMLAFASPLISGVQSSLLTTSTTSTYDWYCLTDGPVSDKLVNDSFGYPVWGSAGANNSIDGHISNFPNLVEGTMIKNNATSNLVSVEAPVNNMTFSLDVTLDVSLSDVYNLISPTLHIYLDDSISTYYYLDAIYCYWVSEHPVNWALYTDELFYPDDAASYSELSDYNQDRYMIFAYMYENTTNVQGVKEHYINLHDMESQGYRYHSDMNHTNLFDTSIPYDDGVGDWLWWSKYCDIDGAVSQLNNGFLRFHFDLQHTLNPTEHPPTYWQEYYSDEPYQIYFNASISDIVVDTNTTVVFSRADINQGVGLFTGSVLMVAAYVVVKFTPSSASMQRTYVRDTRHSRRPVLVRSNRLSPDEIDRMVHARAGQRRRF